MQCPPHHVTQDVAVLRSVSHEIALKYSRLLKTYSCRLSFELIAPYIGKDYRMIDGFYRGAYYCLLALQYVCVGTILRRFGGKKIAHYHGYKSRILYPWAWTT